MNDTEKLKYARNILLGLHKNLVDFERISYENVHGPQAAGQFLNVLLENQDFAWLRKFSMLIVEIDEMFDLKDGVTPEMVAANLAKISELVSMKEPDEYFRSKYQNAIQNDIETAAAQGKLQALMS
jgi:hypothetical protein